MSSLWRGLMVVVLTSWGIPAGAEVYTWIDDEGVVHVTNVPSDPRAQVLPLEGSKNTFSWKDDLGKMRKVHRVDITDYDATIIEAAKYYTLPPAFIKAVIATESAFEPEAISKAGARGLMQLMPKTARAMQVRDSFNPRANIYGGTRYLRLLANRFKGDVRLTAAAYNAGPEAVEKAGGIPPFQETRTYVRRVLRLYQHYLENGVDAPQ